MLEHVERGLSVDLDRGVLRATVDVGAKTVEVVRIDGPDFEQLVRPSSAPLIEWAELNYGRPALPDGAVLAMADRTYVCDECGHGGPRLSREAMSFLRTAAGRAPADVAATGGPAAALREIEVAHNRLIAMHLEKELRSAKVVRQL